MKSLALAAALAAFGTTAMAGGLAPTIQTPTIIEDTAKSSANGLIVPVMLLLFILAAMASDAADPV